MQETSKEQVRTYLAYWFQLGKKVIGSHTILFPQPIFQGNRYSPEFEQCWQTIVTGNNENFYLEGTEQSISELLSATWEIVSCARCEMPVPIKSRGVVELGCPCFDLPEWPNFDLPQPRSAIDNTTQIEKIRDRLKRS